MLVSVFRRRVFIAQLANTMGKSAEAENVKDKSKKKDKIAKKDKKDTKEKRLKEIKRNKAEEREDEDEDAYLLSLGALSPKKRKT